jgi:hypothetical protein
MRLPLAKDSALRSKVFVIYHDAVVSLIHNNGSRTVRMKTRLLFMIPLHELLLVKRGGFLLMNLTIKLG